MVPERSLADSNITPFTRQLRHKIRHAQEPDNPCLLMTWFHLEESECNHCNQEQQWLRYKSSVELLLDTFTDELNPAHWRALCLDNLIRPLSCLQRLVKSDHQAAELRQLLQDVSTLSHYFTPNFSQSH